MCAAGATSGVPRGGMEGGRGEIADGARAISSVLARREVGSVALKL